MTNPFAACTFQMFYTKTLAIRIDDKQMKIFFDMKMFYNFK